MTDLNSKAGIDVEPILRIIPRDQHDISRKNISKAALSVLYRLNQAGHEAFLVGGAVRDLLLGGKPKDFDVATNATPGQVRELFRNSRLIGRRFRLAHILFGREIIEVATFRSGDAKSDGDSDRHVVNGIIIRDNVWGTIEEDALCRDFRVNAMYYDVRDFSVRDYASGMQDIKHRVLRLIGDPIRRYREDPVRMLRAVRLAAKLEFKIDAAAQQPFAQMGHLLAQTSPSRLFDESLKMFLSGHGMKSFRMLEKYGLLAFILPLTARTLQRGDARLRRLIEHGLDNTDQRVAEGKSVTPAFLFSVLLWGEVREQAQAFGRQGESLADAWKHAVWQVTSEQCQRVAIPRRFVLTIETIWLLQTRFEQIQRHQVLHLLAHPRFRAAFDFLLLRTEESSFICELGQWWTHAQQLPLETLAAALPEVSDTARPRRQSTARRRRRYGARSS